MTATEATGDTSPFPFSGDPALQAPVLAALRNVVDPELALSLIDLGLVYGVAIADHTARVQLTMTSAGCPLSDLIFDDIRAALDNVLPPDHVVEIDLCWDPPWTPERMSPSARQIMGW